MISALNARTKAGSIFASNCRTLISTRWRVGKVSKFAGRLLFLAFAVFYCSRYGSPGNRRRIGERFVGQRVGTVSHGHIPAQHENFIARGKRSGSEIERPAYVIRLLS